MLIAVILRSFFWIFSLIFGKGKKDLYLSGGRFNYELFKKQEFQSNEFLTEFLFSLFLVKAKVYSAKFQGTFAGAKLTVKMVCVCKEC